MKIGELAKAAGCQPVTVRFYERKGLLGRPERTHANYRVYGAKDVERLLFIRNCRALGLTIEEIERLVQMIDYPEQDCSDVNACLDRHMEEVDRQMQALSLLKQALSKLRSRCAVPGATSGCGVLTALTRQATVIR